MRYSYAQLSGADFGFFRLPGDGLGNLLFPWARFIVATRKYNLAPIEPTWFQIKIGAILRNERDKRFYHNLFRRPSGQIHGFQKLYFLNTLKKISEAKFREQFQNQNTASSVLVVFRGMNGYFSEILKDHQFILTELLNMTRNRYKKGFQYSSRSSIGVHVRLGDFGAPKNGRVLKQGWINYRISLGWYVHQIQQIRRAVDDSLPVHVFSDGSDEELSELLALNDVKRVYFGSSIADLLALSRSGVLIASGSTFSMWASYLGRMPVIWHPGQLRQRLYDSDEPFEVECDDNGQLPEPFLEAVSRKLRMESHQR